MLLKYISYFFIFFIFAYTIFKKLSKNIKLKKKIFSMSFYFFKISIFLCV